MVANLRREPASLQPVRVATPTRDLCVHEVFEAQAVRTPQATALVFEGRGLTYRQLSFHSNRFATRLQELGVVPGSFVALYVPRSIETIICLLGILKAGGAYVALDMESPADRIAQILALVQPKVIITLHPLARDLPPVSAELIYLNEEFDLHDTSTSKRRAEPPYAPVAAADVAYVAFTSGSTGMPKGVCVPHRAVVRLARADDFISVRREDTFLQFAPISFDASTFEIWSCLLNGAKLAIFPPWKPSLTDLGEFIDSQRVSILWLGAGLFHQMVENQLHHLRHVRRLFTGGDVVSPAHAAIVLRELKNCRLVNGYGPTENTTFSCCHPILTIPPDGRSIPIGRPVAGTECRVLDEMLRPVGEGEAGELYVGGDGLADGYLGNRQLTLEKFIANPFSRTPGDRLYRTGDRVRYLPDGNLEFLGRADRQVKILGYRVEIEEIETALRRHPAVKDARVIVERPIAGNERVIAAIAPAGDANVTAEDLRAFANASLPAHMVPSEFTFLDEMPLNANGKIDNGALAARCSLEVRPATPAPLYLNPIAAKIAAIWTYVLGRPNIGPSDNFFELGGNSLRAAHLLARIQKELKRRIPMEVFFKDPTVKALAAFLDADKPSTVHPEWVRRLGGRKPALFCFPGQGGEMFAYLKTVDHFSGARSVYGLQIPAVREMEDGTSIEEMAAQLVKTIRSLQANGPYHLFGFCFGGLLAFEAARQLRAENAEVGFVGVLQFDIHDMPSMPFKSLRFRSIYFYLRNFLPALAEFFKIGREERNLVILRTLYRLLALPGDSVTSFPQMTPDQRMYAIHEAAWRRYMPHAVADMVTILRPHRLPIFHPDPTLGWGTVKGQRLQVRVVPGIGIHGECLNEGAGLARVIEDAVEVREFALRDQR